MGNDDNLQEPSRDDEPQVYKPEKGDRGWTFNRRDFLKMALAATAGAVASSLPGVKDILGRRVQLIAHSTELSQAGLQPGGALTKVWYLKNNADQPWGEGAVLSLVGASIWGAVRMIRLPDLAPGEVTSVRVPMIAPDALDQRTVEASVAVANEEYKIFLPLIHKSPVEPPCTCDGDIPCVCHTDIPCTCDYDVPCGCHTFYCPCDYEVPCVCDVYICPCDYDVPCICDYDVPCGCDYYYPCGCVYFY